MSHDGRNVPGPRFAVHVKHLAGAEREPRNILHEHENGAAFIVHKQQIPHRIVSQHDSVQVHGKLARRVFEAEIVYLLPRVRTRARETRPR